MTALRIGTRGSALALWQARSVARALSPGRTEEAFELLGPARLRRPLQRKRPSVHLGLHDGSTRAGVKGKPPGQQLERQRVGLLVHPMVLDQRMVDIPQDQSRAHDGKA